MSPRLRRPERGSLPAVKEVGADLQHIGQIVLYSIGYHHTVECYALDGHLQSVALIRELDPSEQCPRSVAARDENVGTREGSSPIST
jgi:hypothetical protein